MKYRKKPVVVEAVQWFSLGDHPKVERPWRSRSDFRCPHCSGAWGKHGVIKTMEDSQDGGHFVCPADWIICGVVGEYYACKPDVFERTYEPEATLPEALPKDKVLVSRALLEHAQRTSSDVVVRIAIHNALVNVDESRDPRNTPSPQLPQLLSTEKP